MSHEYLIGYDVAGASRLEAVTNAVTLLRTGVRLLSVYRIDELAGGRWHVVLNVSEDA